MIWLPRNSCCLITDGEGQTGFSEWNAHSALLFRWPWWPRQQQTVIPKGMLLLVGWRACLL